MHLLLFRSSSLCYSRGIGFDKYLRSSNNVYHKQNTFSYFEICVINLLDENIYKEDISTE